MRGSRILPQYVPRARLPPPPRLIVTSPRSALFCHPVSLRRHHQHQRNFTSTRSQELQPSMTIHRTTLFKIPEEAQREKLLEFYKGMSTKALKDGKPYIISVKAGPTFDDQRRQGFTFAAQSVFASEEDMKYYDNGCAAHAELKEYAKTVHQGIMMVYFEDKLA